MPNDKPPVIVVKRKSSFRYTADPSLRVKSTKSGYRFVFRRHTLPEDSQRELNYKQQHAAARREPQNFGHKTLVQRSWAFFTEYGYESARREFTTMPREVHRRKSYAGYAQLYFGITPGSLSAP